MVPGGRLPLLNQAKAFSYISRGQVNEPCRHTFIEKRDGRQVAPDTGSTRNAIQKGGLTLPSA
jgi:hypothetical protein